MGRRHGAKADAADGVSDIIHASCVALDGRAVLILGASGQGKSTLALQLMALGAGLVADDRTVLSLDATAMPPCLQADAPPPLRGMIEARGIGLLQAKAVGPCAVHLVVDLDRTETARLPDMRQISLLGQALPVFHRVDSPSFPAAILQYLKAGRSA
jgi:HPr kinase/phosphorylase